MTSPAQALPASSTRSTPISTTASSGCFDFLRIQRSRPTPLQGPVPAAGRARRPRPVPASDSTPASPDGRSSDRGGQGRDAYGQPRACCLRSLRRAAGRSARSVEAPPFAPRIATLPDGRKIIGPRAAPAMTKAGDDLRRGLPRVQGGHREHCAAHHHEIEGRGVRLEPHCSASSRTMLTSSSSTSRWSATPACGTARRRGDERRCAAWSTRRRGSPAADRDPAFRPVRRRGAETRCGCSHVSSRPCTTTSAA